MNLLLIAPIFFGYEKLILRQLTSLGFVVDFVPDRHLSSPAGKAAIRYAAPLFERFYIDFLRRELLLFGRTDYDIILVIQGESVNLATLQWMRASFPRATFNFYSWDNFSNKPRSVALALNGYDRVMSFDEKDAIAYGAEFRPLFFAQMPERPSNLEGTDSANYDLTFIGSLHSDRAKIVSQFESFCAQQNLSFFHYIYLQSGWVYYMRKYAFRTTADYGRSDFSTQPLPLEVVNAISRRSSSLLDIEHPRQSGATMRTFETLALGRKLVTCNEAVRTLGIYSRENIFIFDRERPVLPPLEFFEAPFSPIPDSLLKEYSLEEWARFVSNTALGPKAAN